MFDFQVQTIATRLVIAEENRLPVEKLASVLRNAMNEQDDAVLTTESNLLEGVSVHTGSATLHAHWQIEDGAQVLSLALGGGTAVDASEGKELQTRLTRVLRPLLDTLPVDAVEWLDTGVQVPADAFRAALLPEDAPKADAPISTKIAPRRVARTASRPAKARLSTAEAQARIADTQNPTVTPRRVTASAAKTRRLSTAAAARIAGALPMVAKTSTDKGPIGAERYDAHVRCYEAQLCEMIRRDASADEIEALRSDDADRTTGARLSTWAVSLGVASVSLPMALPVIAHNVMRGEDLRAASLVLGLAGTYSIANGTGAMAGVLGVL